MKKIISIITATAMFIMPVTGFAAGKTYELNIEQAINMAVENDNQKEIDDLNIKIKEINLEEAKVTALFGESSPALENAYKVNVEPIKVETDLDMARRSKATNLENLKLSVYKACLNNLLATKELEKEKQRLDILNEKYNSIRVQFDIGKVTELDLFDIDYKIENKKLDIVKLEQKLDNTSLELKRLLNCDLDRDTIILSDKISFQDIKEIDIDEVIGSVQAKDDKVYEKQQNTKIKEKSLEQTSHYSVKGEFNYEQANFSLETAKYELKDIERKLEVDISNKYNDLLNQKDSTELAIKYSELIDRAYEIAKIKYDNGIINKQELLNAIEKQLDANYQKISEISNYNCKKAEFETLIGQSINK